jgi:hypothetical protein
MVGVEEGVGVIVGLFVAVLVGVGVEVMAANSLAWLKPMAIVATAVMIKPSITPITILVICWSTFKNKRSSRTSGLID